MDKQTPYTLIVYSGESKKSFDYQILEKTIVGLTARNKEYKIIDLLDDGFNPTFEGKDLRFYSRGETTDENVLKYQELLRGCNELILVYKIENNAPTVLLKGFFDIFRFIIIIIRS